MSNILSVLENFSLDNADDIAISMAHDFRKRRLEKNLTREQVAERSNVALSNIVRFEQKGLISLKNLIVLAMAMDYTSEVKTIDHLKTLPASVKFITEDGHGVQDNATMAKAFAICTENSLVL